MKKLTKWDKDKINEESFGALLGFGVNSVLVKQDYKAIETHKYTKEELALIEKEEIKREIDMILTLEVDL